jgi:large subunit ribosomal protein L15
MKLNQLADNPGAHKTRMRVGRGIGSGKGKTGGRGVKGQKSRTGVRIKGFEGGQMPIHRRLPKRGFVNIHARKLNEVNLGRVQEAIDSGVLDAAKPVTIDVLVEAGVLSKKKGGVRLLGGGELKIKASFEVWGASKSAKEAVEKLGGSVKVLAPPRPERAPRKTYEVKAEPEAKKEEKPKQAKPKETNKEAKKPAGQAGKGGSGEGAS